MEQPIWNHELMDGSRDKAGGCPDFGFESKPIKPNQTDIMCMNNIHIYAQDIYIEVFLNNFQGKRGFFSRTDTEKTACAMGTQALT